MKKRWIHRTLFALFIVMANPQTIKQLETIYNEFNPNTSQLHYYQLRYPHTVKQRADQKENLSSLSRQLSNFLVH